MWWNHEEVEQAPGFPFLLGGAFIEAGAGGDRACLTGRGFPFLLGGAFIEATCKGVRDVQIEDFPSFLEGLSLRLLDTQDCTSILAFPFLLGGAFIEALLC